MRQARACPRPRPRSLRSGAFFLSALLLCVAAPGPVSGQDPDTTATPLAPVAPDTMPQPIQRDSLLADTTAQDSAVPPPRLPDMGPVGPVGWEAGVWEWRRQDLLRLPDLSVLQLLERVPGVVPVRPAFVGQAEAPAIMGAAAAAVTWIVDGFEVDPLSTPTFDPSRFPLLALERIRVERRVTGVTVRVRTLSSGDHRVESIVEAATGDYNTNLFRGTFLAPDVLGGPLAAGFERLATGGFGRASNHTAGWLKWTFVRDSAGVQAEYRQSQMDRSGVGAGLFGRRSDWALRARASLLGVRTEAFAGASAVEDDHGVLTLREGTPQGGVRLFHTFDGPLPAQLRGTLRLRSHPRLPGTETGVEAWVTPRHWIGVGAEVTQGWWDDGDITGRWTARATVGPLLGLRALAELTGGPPWLSDPATVRLTAPVDSPVYRVDRSGARLGLSLDRWGLHLGVAGLQTWADPVAGFGLAFDPAAPRFPGGEAVGLEVTTRIPTGFDPIWLEGWYVGMDAPASWLYLPRHHWRAALVYHHLPLPSGNLELYGRVEHVYRDRMATPCDPPLECDVEGPGAGVAAYRATNLELNIRVLTVRAFLRWENIRHRLQQQNLPGYDLPGQRILYGVKWTFFN